jgi:hypothetical protein
MGFVRQLGNISEERGAEMKHILGMAKSNLDLRGAKGLKLELDLLRLVYAVKELRSRVREEAQGYLLVMTQGIAERAMSWMQKYEAGDAVVVVEAGLSHGDLAALRAEKNRNVAGMVAGTLGEVVGDQSDAALGKRLGEKELRNLIISKEPGANEITDERKFPFGVRWDFYGQSGLPGE